MDTKTVIVVVCGILLGISIGVVVRYYHSRVYKGPSSKKIKRKIYYDDSTGQHYRFETVTYVCPPSVDVSVLEHSDDEDDDST